MRIGPAISYYGAKWRAAKTYPAPKHDTIIEPFAGGAGYALLHYEHDVILLDKYEPLARMWSWLIAANPDEIRSLPLISEDEKVSDMPICDEAKTLIGFWINAGTVQPCNTMSPFARINASKGNACVWGEKCRERVAIVSSKIKHWRVIQGDYTQAPDLTATWFVDPPYQNAGKYYKHGSSQIDFSDLGTWCKERRGQVIVCENEGADWLDFTYHGQAKSMSTRGKTHSSEVLWVREHGVG